MEIPPDPGDIAGTVWAIYKRLEGEGATIQEAILLTRIIVESLYAAGFQAMGAAGLFEGLEPNDESQS